MPLKNLKTSAATLEKFKAKVEAEQESEDDILAPPKDLNSDSSDGQSNDIHPSFFPKSSQEPISQPVRSRAAPKRTVNGGNGSAKSTVNSGTSPNSSFTSSSESTKRKQQGTLSQLGADMFDAFGRKTSKRPKQSSTYGSSQSRYGSSQGSKTNLKVNKKPSDGQFFHAFYCYNH